MSDDGDRYPFKDAEHTVRAGMALGAAVGAGLDVDPVVNSEGDWSAAFDIKIAASVTIRVVVQ